MRLSTRASVLILSAYLLMAAVANAQSDSIYRVPAGTKFSLRLEVALSSSFASRGDTFIAYVAEPVRIRDSVVIPAATVIEGTVDEVIRAGRNGKNGRLVLRFATIRLSGGPRPLDARRRIVEMDGRGTAATALTILVPAAGGGLIGSTARGSRGTLLGIGIGAASGSIVNLLRKGSEALISKDDVFEIELERDLMLPVTDY